MKLLRQFLIACAAVLVCAPVWGYVVILKDGTQLITKEKYRRDGDKVFLILPSGTETFIDATEVDFKATDELNTMNIGQARLIEQQASTVIVEKEPEQGPASLSQVAQGRRLSLPEATTSREDEDVPHQLPLTEAGFVDLWSLERAVHSDLEISGEVARHLEAQAAGTYEVFQGTAADRILVEIKVNTEAAIFKAMKDAASALVQAHTLFPERVDALELVMSTAKGSRAGQFVFTRELADDLLAGSLDPPTYFYRHVQF